MRRETAMLRTLKYFLPELLAITFCSGVIAVALVAALGE